MNRLIIRIETLSDDFMKKHNLVCRKRAVYYDYENKIISSCGIPEHLGLKVNNYLKTWKCRFTKKTLPLF